jgi:Flp pilus assembly protein TadG
MSMSGPETLATPRAPNRRLRRRLASFLRNRKGAAAVEFAFVLPIMMTMYFGLVELSSALGHDAKASRLSNVLSDMVTQSIGVTNADMNTIFNAAASVIQPFPVERIAMRVTSYLIDGAGNAFVDWSDVKNISAPNPYAPRARCLQANGIVAAGLRVPRTSIVISEVTINHVPTIGQIVAPGGVNMKSEQPTRPRITGAVSREGVPTTNCPGYAP